ncbi:MAG: hypothetical protein P0Y53_19210 [Candidatus Pseudobacter hemicellulosilyticus]|uniref:Uncharacterized protein n=1 Tax=Candidatus Pseudobacter hemicellulosilyticus TaxID=3121375 RepID=A0AAJ5WPN4_9BACT|nr:MAG: hypothetical protein P0Y53_19210 [Pseudobacter sp.]
MPANKKYLTTSPLQRTLKITAGIAGGFLVSIALHQFLMLFLPKKEVIVTMPFTAYLVWAVLMVVAFLATNGWKIWGWYLLSSVLLFSPYIYQIYFKH